MSQDEQLSGGQMFGRYQIVRPIGEGGMGVVYEAIHPALKKRFAIKTLHPSHARMEEARLRFVREAEAASSINHPNVVTVSDVGIEGHLPYMVMELLEGQTLDQHLAARGALSVEEAVGLLLPVIGAVAAGHDRGVIHRDLKPQNIFLARGRRDEIVPKVLDFGVSKVTGDENLFLTKTMSVLGTAAYMSPEQARGAKRVDLQSDQYSLGLIFYEALTGSRAYPGESALEILHNAASGLVRPAREVRADLPRDIDAILTRMLAASVAERFPSLYDAGRALLPFADDRTRLTLASEFAAPSVAPRGPAAAVRLALAASQDRSLSALPTGSLADVRTGGTRVLPVTAEHGLTDTTMGHAASEVSVNMARDVGRRPNRRFGLAVAGVLCLAVVGAGIVFTSRRSAPRATTQDKQQERDKQQDKQSETRSAFAPVDPGDKPAGGKVAAAPAATRAPSALFEIRSTPPEAEIVLDDRPPVRGRVELVLPLGGSSHLVRVSAPGYVSKVVPFGAAERPPSEVHLERIARPTTASAPPEKKRDPSGPSATRGTGQAGLASSGPATGSGPAAGKNSPGHLAAPGRERTDQAAAPARPSKPVNARTEIDPPKPNEAVSPPKRGANNSLMIPN